MLFDKQPTKPNFRKKPSQCLLFLNSKPIFPLSLSPSPPLYLTSGTKGSGVLNLHLSYPFTLEFLLWPVVNPIVANNHNRTWRDKKGQ